VTKGLSGREDAAARCRPPLHPSGDREKRGDDERQEAREALKAMRQQQEPDSLMAELIKRQMKRKTEKKEKCV